MELTSKNDLVSGNRGKPSQNERQALDDLMSRLSSVLGQGVKILSDRSQLNTFEGQVKKILVCDSAVEEQQISACVSMINEASNDNFYFCSIDYFESHVVDSASDYDVRPADVRVFILDHDQGKYRLIYPSDCQNQDHPFGRDQGVTSISLQSDFQSTFEDQPDVVIDTNKTQNEDSGAKNDHSSPNHLIMRDEESETATCSTVDPEFRQTTQTNGTGSVQSCFNTGPESNELDSQKKPELIRKDEESINILLLGETGVGKSTFINAYYNYLTFGSLEEAMKEPKLHGLICSTFSFTDRQYNIKTLKVPLTVAKGHADLSVSLKEDGIDSETNEASEQGQSSTQHAKAYEFMHQGRLLRLIDTPGIGDSRGISKDQTNFKQTIEYLSRLDHLNAVCILLKPNVKRMELHTRYCIKELFSHLNKVSIQNVVFCFTNTRVMDFRPGDTLPTLREYIKKEIEAVSNVKMPLSRDNIFCMDNEAFRYLLLAKNVKSEEERMFFKEFDKQETFAESWQISKEASEELVKYAQMLPVLKMSEMVAYNQSRSMSLELVEKMIDVLVRLVREHENNPSDKAYDANLDHLINVLIESIAAITTHLSSNSLTVFNDQFDAYFEEKIKALKQSTIERDLRILPLLESLLNVYRLQLANFRSAEVASALDVESTVSLLENIIKLVLLNPKDKLIRKTSHLLQQQLDRFTADRTRIREGSTEMSIQNSDKKKFSFSKLLKSLFPPGFPPNHSVNSDSTDPSTQLNLILFGPSGAGKSSLINLFTQLLAFDSFKAAKKGEMKCPILPNKSDNLQDKIDIQENSAKDAFFAQSYPLDAQVDEKLYYLNVIDTPGIGDTRGFEQNKQNLDKVIEYIAKNFESVSAICFVLRPIDSQLAHQFRYCLKELLIRLDRASAPNICFCYTHARGISFNPNESNKLIKKEMAEIANESGISIPFETSNTFCFDSEAIEFLVANKKGMSLGSKERETFDKLWEQNTDSLNKLIVHATKLSPASIKSISVLNQARKTLIRLASPIAEISQIKTTQHLDECKKRELENINKSIESLKKLLYIEKVELVKKPLKTPKTVCTHTFCHQELINNGIAYSECSQGCVDGVEAERINQPLIKKSPVFENGTNDECIKCGHNWNLHMYVTDEFDEVKKKVEDPEVKKNIEAKKRRKDILKGRPSATKNDIKDLKAKQSLLIESSAKIAKYIKTKGILYYNRDLEQYLDLLIKEEEQKQQEGSNNQDVLDGLKKEKEDHETSVKILTDNLNSGIDVDIVSDAGIEKLLYELKKYLS